MDQHQLHPLPVPQLQQQNRRNPAGRDTFTQVERENLKIRDELLADGTWFAVAKSDVNITQATPQPDGSAFVIATITTTLTEGGKDGKPTPGT